MPVVRATERAEMTSSGIVLPGTAREEPRQGTVVAVGRGRLNEHAGRLAPGLKAILERGDGK